MKNSCSHLSFNPCSFVLLESFHVAKRRVYFGKVDIRDIFYFLPPLSIFNELEYALIVVYDITQRRSFEKAKELIHRLAKFASPLTYQRARPLVFGALVGNKADLEDKREVSFEVSNVAMFMWWHCTTCTKTWNHVGQVFFSWFL